MKRCGWKSKKKKRKKAQNTENDGTLNKKKQTRNCV
jgi:hypothetical protein